MQTTPTVRRFVSFPVRQVTIALLIAVGIAVSVLAAVMIGDDGSVEAEPARVALPVGVAHLMFDHQFMEQNFHLPVAPESATVDSSAPDWRVLEQNNWGEDFVLTSLQSDSYYPSVDDVPQHEAGQVTY